MKNFNLFLEAKGISSEDFKGKSAEDMAVLYNEYNEKTRTDLADAIESKATKEDIDSLKAELESNNLEQSKALNSALKEYGVAIKKLTESEKEEKAG